MSKVYARDSIASDIGELLRVGLRECDRVEALRIRGGDDEGLALHDSVVLSSICRTVIVGGKVAAMFGVVPHSLYSCTGDVWFLASDLVDEERRAFAVISRNEINAMMDTYSAISNFVDVENTKSIRWLRWLGFTVSDQPVPVGPYRSLFYRFERLACA